MGRRSSPADVPIRRALCAAAALALMVRALIPGGWMPVATAAGLELRLCPAFAPAAAPPATDHHAHAPSPAPEESDHHKGGGQGDQPCAFAGLALAAADPDPPVLLAPSPSQTQQPPLSSVAIGRGLAAPPPPSTGPPILT
jgi:hypothetical protein